MTTLAKNGNGNSALISRQTRSTGQAARMLGLSVDTVVRYIEDGTLKGYQPRPGARWRVYYDSIVDYATRANKTIDGELPPT